MCFSKESSLTSFIAGLGFSILGISLSKNKQEVVLHICWLVVILMQLWEYMVYDDPDNTKKCHTVSKIAMISNLVQPLMGLLFLFTIVPSKFQIISGCVLALIYIAHTLYTFNFKKQYCIYNKTTQKCDLLWWSEPKAKYLVATFLIVATLMPLSTLGLTKISIVSSLEVLLSFIVTSLFYSDRAGGGSVWCYYAAFVPFLNFCIFYLMPSIKK